MKPFRFLGVHVDLSGLAKRCLCTAKHVKVQGTYTKASATYVPDLVSALAKTFEGALRITKSRVAQDATVKVEGLENQLSACQ